MKAKSYSKDELHEFSMSSNKKALELYSKSLEAENEKDYAKAVDYLLKALKKDSLFAFAWDNLGLNYRRLGEYDKAIDAYEHSIRVDPNGKLPWQNMAIAYEMKKDYIGAIICFKKLALLDVTNPEIYYGIGRISATHLGDYESALENICIAFSLYKEINSPDIKDAKQLIGLIYDAMKKNGDEERYNQILLKHFPKTDD
jgi:tetratricopeptide (TPR) repeat protein